MMPKKLRRGSRGFTLMETLVASLLIVLAASVVVVGSQAAVRVTAGDSFASESQTVADTVDRALSDVLRYATDVRTDSGGQVVSYDCGAYGIAGGTVRIGAGAGEGKIYLSKDDDSLSLLNDFSYAGLSVVPADYVPGSGGGFGLKYAGGVFSGAYRLYDAGRGMLSDVFEFSFRAVNG